MDKQFINQHDMSVQQKRFYSRMASARNQYQELGYRGALPITTGHKKSRWPGLAIAASVAAMAAVLLVKPFDNQATVHEAAVFANDLPQSLPAMGSIIPKMNRASTSLFANRPRLSAKHRPSFKAPARPLKDSA